ncbi:MAG: hypothetical protein K2H41_12950 [Acetatifactor sp.]|nr:hypothetical protein [Acetatifactor sp.]MDE7112934.1 hypothetical protein [Acetatifactor sp.]
MAENKYGHLLDKYMDDKHVDYRTKQEREQARSALNVKSKINKSVETSMRLL